MLAKHYHHIHSWKFTAHTKDSKNLARRKWIQLCLARCFSKMPAY